MPQSLNKSLEVLESSKEFKNWYKNNNNSFLSNCFTIVENPKIGIVNWEISYYSQKKDEITSFLVNKDKITIKENQKILKQKNSKIGKLDTSKIKFKLNAALNKIKKKIPGRNTYKNNHHLTKIRFNRLEYNFYNRKIQHIKCKNRF